ncbi:TatD family hydrolase [Candidatus Saccharibacteria bacterium]|nr:TatD family hydrolase [Candidatus Saccharibacteria bacterium]
MKFVDTHCHIHDSEFVTNYDKTQDELLADARAAGVEQCVCVGTDVKSSLEAVRFARSKKDCYASLALHPHEAADRDSEELASQVSSFRKLLDENDGTIVAIGECGLDYYYHPADEVRQKQKALFGHHIELALEYQLPLIFHIRNAQKRDKSAIGQAFEDFFRIIDTFENISGVVHSFSAAPAELKGCLDRGLYVGLNGIMTFSKQTDQLLAAKMVPLENMVLETDAPFLTPAPFRGKMCEPKHVRVTAEFLSDLRGESLEDVAEATTRNAQKLFGIK